MGCSGLRLNNIDIINAPLAIWSLAEQILDFNKKHNKKLDITPYVLNKNLKEIKNFYFWTIAKNEDDFIKICDLINKFDGINEAKNIARNLSNQALTQLNIFPNNIYKNYLSTILEYSLQRIF